MSSALARANQGLETPPRQFTSDETKAALIKSFKEVINHHQVCSFSFLIDRVRELGVAKTYLQCEDAEDAIVAARTTFFTSDLELRSIMDAALRCIHDVYVMEKGPDPDQDPLRDVIIDLFCAKGPNVKLTRKSFEKAMEAKYPNWQGTTTKELHKVLHELCVAVEGHCWVLKPGCGRLICNIPFDQSTIGTM